MNRVKIAVVEDEIIIADNICETLASLGYNVLEPAIILPPIFRTTLIQK